MWLKWLPWRLVVSRLARTHGFIDPIAVLARLHRFAQPSEVAEPIELLRAGVVFHARGLINSRAIQHNLDWVWPFWVERQFDPADVAFVPRAFSLTHVNLTHRNWTAVGQPDTNWMPIVDPRGLLTPLYDGWSIDAWIIPEKGPPLLPSRAADARQQLLLDEDNLRIETALEDAQGRRLHGKAEMTREQGERPWCRLRVRGHARDPGWLVIALRPANPEGISFIHHVAWDAPSCTLLVNDETRVHMEQAPQRVAMSHYRAGDVLQRLLERRSVGPRGAAEGDGAPREPEQRTSCDVGLCTAAALYRLEAGATTEVVVRIPWSSRVAPKGTPLEEPTDAAETWPAAVRGCCEIQTPDERIDFLFRAAIYSLVLHSPGEVYPGPYTYRRFWFRDAAFIVSAMLAAGLTSRAERAIERFPASQTALGYFHSQEGEWDSNGEAIWAIDLLRLFGGTPLPGALVDAVRRGARWIIRKRLPQSPATPHAGLMPAGFSAEHLGPSDFYYWDDFWSIAGLERAAAIMRATGAADSGAEFDAAAASMRDAVERSLAHPDRPQGRPGVPASPYRRMDAGAIGSLAAGYPLAIWPAREQRLLQTVEFLLRNCMVGGGFFQDMIHSGINPYLTLHMAQVLLRAGDRRCIGLMNAVRDLASPTGQWPEAIHPHTGGGCMGDGQHVWAAAEWILMVRNCFVREEGDALIIGAGLPANWLVPGAKLRFGPTATPHGPITLHIEADDEMVNVRWQARWRGPAPPIAFELEGCARAPAAPRDADAAHLARHPAEALEERR